eukprot:scaffold17346_cov29-Tisochrysis_lutea.AAC.3
MLSPLSTICYLPWVSKDSSGSSPTCPASRLPPPRRPLPPHERQWCSVSDAPPFPLPRACAVYFGRA